jgi:hypothetical protein
MMMKKENRIEDEEKEKKLSVGGSLLDTIDLQNSTV